MIYIPRSTNLLDLFYLASFNILGLPGDLSYIRACPGSARFHDIIACIINMQLIAVEFEADDSGTPTKADELLTCKRQASIRRTCLIKHCLLTWIGT